MSVTTSTANQPLPLRRRPELESREITYRRQCYWSIKDPLSLRYYQLRDEEHFVLSLLDGQTSLSEIQQQFQARFAPRRIDLPQLNWFLGMLHREGLVFSEAADQGRQLISRRQRSQRRQFWSGLGHLLAIRFRGINPARMVDGIYPLVRWMFSPWCVAAMAGLVVVAATLLALEWRTAVDRLPNFSAFFGPENILWMACALAAVKVLHELGHALTCRHFGGQCRELGMMLLVFTPCLYCNVSDAWMISNKWKRMAVSGAGIYVELVIASVCLLLWWFSEPGAFNAFCLNLVFVCSVGTVAFNGNPLLRYDGYFILADWLEIPNLAQRGSQYVREWLLAQCAGLESNAVPPGRGERWLLVGYTLASWGYRVVIVAAILWFLQAALKPYGLQAVASGLAIITVGGMIAMPILQAASALRDPFRRRKLRWLRAASVAICLSLGTAALLAVPLPCRVAAPVVLEAADPVPIYVTAPGRLVAGVREGDRVKQGQMIARLTNIELEKEVAQLAAELAVQQRHAKTLARQQSRDLPGDVLGAGGQLPVVLEAIADLENRLQDRQAEQDRLTLRAPRDGTILPPRPIAASPPPGELEAWSGTPLQTRNRGATLATGTRVCWVGDPDHIVAQLVVDESAIAKVRPGQSVRIYVDELPGQFLNGTVAEIAQWDTNEPPPELVAKRLVPERPAAGEPPALSATSYQVRADLQPHDAALPLRASGRAVIVVEPQTVARRGYEFLCRTFRIEL